MTNPTDDHPDYADILATCLDMVLSKRATIETCVAEYPHYADSLRQELSIALLITKLKPPTLSDNKVASIEARLMKSLPSQKVLRPHFGMIRRNVAAIFLIIVVIFAGSAGTVAASADALPGDALYGVKRWWESVVVFIATIVGDTETVLIQLAETRLDEMTRLAEIGGDSSQNLSDLASAIENVLRYNSDLTSREVNFLQATHRFLIGSSVVDSPLAQNMLDEIAPFLTVIPERPPASDMSSDSPMTPTPTATVAPSVVLSPTATASPIESITQVFTPTPSATSRIPPTPTRTATPTATPTKTVLAPIVPTSTPTWTAYPTSTPAPTITPSMPVIGITATANGGGIVPVPSVTWYPWQQATWDTCYLTRTVDPYGNINDPYCNSTLPPPVDPESLGVEVTP
ncbi:MAG: hypothetical protein SFZ02_12225 [bacterium]|nr:hypothetical protein [bacterium]